MSDDIAAAVEGVMGSAPPTPSLFIPADWYWRASDGRLYGSARHDLVPAGDETFAGWPGTPTVWPRDADGVQTDEALCDVLVAAGLPAWPRAAGLKAYAGRRRWEIETGGLMVSGLSIRTDEQSQAKISGACVLLGNDPDMDTIDWEAQPGQWVTMDRSSMLALGVAVGRHVQACFTALRLIQGKIAAAPPTITTTTEVDAAFAAILSPPAG